MNINALTRVQRWMEKRNGCYRTPRPTSAAPLLYLLAMLNDHRRPFEMITATNESMANWMGCGEKTIYNWQQTLVRLGFIKIVEGPRSLAGQFSRTGILLTPLLIDQDRFPDKHFEKILSLPPWSSAEIELTAAAAPPVNIADGKSYRQKMVVKRDHTPSPKQGKNQSSNQEEVFNEHSRTQPRALASRAQVAACSLAGSPGLVIHERSVKLHGANGRLGGDDNGRPQNLKDDRETEPRLNKKSWQLGHMDEAPAIEEPEPGVLARHVATPLTDGQTTLVSDHTDASRVASVLEMGYRPWSREAFVDYGMQFDQLMSFLHKHGLPKIRISVTRAREGNQRGGWFIPNLPGFGELSPAVFADPRLSAKVLRWVEEQWANGKPCILNGNFVGPTNFLLLDDALCPPRKILCLGMETSKGKYQYLVGMDRLLDLRSQGLVGRHLADTCPNGDRASTGAGHLFRLPGSRNAKPAARCFTTELLGNYEGSLFDTSAWGEQELPGDDDVNPINKREVTPSQRDIAWVHKAIGQKVLSLEQIGEELARRLTDRPNHDVADYVPRTICNALRYQGDRRPLTLAETQFVAACKFGAREKKAPIVSR